MAKRHAFARGTRMPQACLPRPEIILSDTVGFIFDLADETVAPSARR